MAISDRDLLMVEKEFDVSKLKYRGIHCWPLVKSFLSYRIFFQDLSGFQHYDLERTGAVKGLKSKIDDIHWAYKDWRNIVNLDKEFNELYEKEVLKDNASNWTLKHVDILVVSVTHHSKKNEKGLFYNRITDSFLDFIENDFTFGIIEETDVESIRNFPRNRPSAGISGVIRKKLSKKYRNRVLSKLNVFSKRHEIEGWDEFRAYWLSKKFNTLFCEKIIEEKVMKVLVGRDLFTEILKKTKPKLVVFPVFYDDYHQGFTIACKNEGVKVMELQHGMVGFNLYQGWLTGLKNGFPSIPDYIWTWDKQSCDLIDRNNPDGKSHRPVEGFNPFLELRKSGAIQSDDLDKVADFIDDNKINVIHSVQPKVDDFPVLDDLMMDCLRNSSLKVKWHLRLHPLHKDSYYSDLMEQLKEIDPQKYEVNRSTDLDLIELLKKMDYHITLFSSMCIEAHCFGVRNIIISKQGKSSFIDQLGYTEFMFYEKSDDILRYMEVNGKKNANVIKVENAQNQAVKAIREIIK